jgi:hypothetical protein
MTLPETVCRLCKVPKINGLFTPAELLTYMRCRKCIGELNIKRRPHLAAARLSARARRVS